MVKEFIVGVFEDEHKMMASVHRLRESGYDIDDVFTPYAVHGLDDALGHRRSRLAIVTFLAGLFGMSFALALQFYTNTIDWSVNVGGKPNDSVLGFLPVTFELTVLIGGLTTALAFFVRSRLFPGAKLDLLDERVTDDRFAVVLQRKDASFNPERAKKIFQETGAVRVTERSVES